VFLFFAVYSTRFSSSDKQRMIEGSTLIFLEVVSCLIIHLMYFSSIYIRYETLFWESLSKESTNTRGVLNLSAWLISHGTVFFPHNKSANSTFQPGFSVKRTAPYEHVSSDTLVYLKSIKWYCSCWIMYQECIMCIHSFRDSRSPGTLKISSSENRCYIKLQVTWFFVHAWSCGSNLWPQTSTYQIHSPGSGGARILKLSIPTSTSTKKISCFLIAMGENTIKYGGTRPRNCFLLF
jgi:hypothetical protein